MNHPKELVIVGAGGHARVVADIARLTGHTVVGFLDDVRPERRGESFSGATVLGGLDQLRDIAASGVRQTCVAVGDCEARLRLGERASAAGFAAVVLRHPASVCAADVVVGAGTVLVAGAIVNPGARLGAHVIVNTAASVDHDCVIEDGAHIACGARLAGAVAVGRGTWIGIGAAVREHVRIGHDAVVGAGALVLDDVPDGVVVYGAPARVIRHVAAQRVTSH
jgi:sugar O-acyltransferase (sialic acid O-acetyltransferase NeuD family)